MTVDTILNDPRLKAVRDGACDDPFAVLGPHDHDGKRFVTAFDPAAQKMWAVIGANAYPLTAGGNGAFAGEVDGTAPYGLRGSDGHREWDYEDPYRFGTVISDFDEYLLGEGTHQRLWQVLGAHVMEHEGVAGTHFAVWAPNARRASVVGDFNGWDARRHMMRRRGATGVWETFVPGIGDGAAYKFDLLGPNGPLPLRADPVGFGSQHPPETASIVRDIRGYGWRDAEWMQSRADRNSITAPISIYEVQLGSWRRKAGRPISYKEAAEELVGYVKEMGFTHIELLPVSEYPFDGSWGYQPVGLFAPTIRFGPPHEFRDLVDAAHLAGLGLLIDWVPGHFPTDAHGLGQFDGTHLYEHADPKEGFHNDWNTLIYNFGRSEVANFLTANALYWLEEFHIDGLRVDAVASMLYRDYSRDEGQWVPNKDGGRENYESIALMQRVNTVTYGQCHGIMTVAEESTSFPKVSAPVDAGGLGFGFKWNMGWMNDTLSYMEKEPIYRKHHHHQMTFGLAYAWSENFVLPISHDEVVHGKGSMLGKMPGDRDQKFANLRAYYGFMWGHPGKKLLFMGQEFAQSTEWNHDTEIDWACLGDPMHSGVQRLVRDLNTVYRATPALHQLDCDPAGFEWLVAGDADASVFAWLRHAPDAAPVAVISNMTPVERPYTLHLPHKGKWAEILNTDAAIYGGGNRGNLGGVTTDQSGRAEVLLPPLATVFLTPEE